MYLVRLNIRGFRLFANPVSIEFPPQGVIGLRGFNTTTRSGSDSGKSSLLEAIAMVFGYSSFPMSDQATWLTDAKPQIDAVCVHDGRRYDFHAGTKWGVEIDGEPVAKAQGAAAYKRWLQEFFGLQDLDILRNLAYRPQRQGGLFLGMPDAEKRAFFAEVIGLQRYEDLAAAASRKATEAEQQERSLRSTLDELVAPPIPVEPPAVPAELDCTPEHLQTRLDQAAQDFAEHELPHFNAADVKVIEEKLSQLATQESMVGQQEQNRLRTLQDECRQRIEAEYAERIAAARAEADKKNARLDHARRATDAQATVLRDAAKLITAAEYEVQAAERQLRDAQQSDQRLSVEKQQLVAKLCPTCARPWEDEAYRRRLQAVEVQLSQVCTDLQFIPQAIEAGRRRVAELRADAQAADTRLKAMQAALPRLEAEAAATRGEVTALSIEVQSSITAAVGTAASAIRLEAAESRQVLAENRATLQAEMARLRDAERARAAALTQFEASQREIRRQFEAHRYARGLYEVAIRAQKSFEERRAAVEARLVAAQAATKSWADLQAATKAFLGAISEEILSEIAAEANGILAALPNTAEVTLRFATERVTQKGTVRQEIRPMVSKGGRDGLNLKSQISGGQLTSVELATDPAVSLVLRGRRGAMPTPAWLVFDEAFDGHDVPIKEAFLDVLAGLASRGMQIMVVDHGSEFKESLQSRINIVCRDGISTVVDDTEFDAVVRGSTAAST